ncbi:FecR family protein [Bowmanella dokdonensis]|uniref:FecR domain-containing protein n=1 Tax=Bowmanella dokdonensis TaxID=751969 RepID=A0A939DP32_9ALTE|nr:FecR family protein [Bowmanella dokdonensis]MBN7825351.1 FecR domain-containing protein [Bowmanella dokdonensis]
MFSDPRLTCSLMLLAGLGLPVQAELAPAGKAIMARGQVQASAEQQTRALKRASPVFQVDRVSTGAQSATQLRMLDGGLLSMQPETELAIHDYLYNEQTHQGSVSMSMLKGGLRTVTGALQHAQGQYQMDTPVATIGVRGTHYEARLVQGDLYLAGWQGIIDVQVTVPGKNAGFSLGPDEPYRFAIVRANGEVEFLIGAPALFAEGHNQPDGTGLLAQQAELDFSVEAPDRQLGEPAPSLSYDLTGRDFFDNERLVSEWTPGEGSDISRSGEATFDFLASHSLTSSQGALSSLSMSMQVNFDGAWVPSGNLSFTDSGGEWFAVFNGVLDSQSMDLVVNFASHGNNLADGNIQALLVDDARAILGNLSLFELDNPSVQVGGGFVLTEQP